MNGVMATSSSVVLASHGLVDEKFSKITPKGLVAVCTSMWAESQKNGSVKRAPTWVAE